MDDVIDLPGASGAQYRFRRADLGDLPVMAGNLVVARGPADRREVLLCGAAQSLARAAPTAAEVLQAHHDARLYVRLNVARAVREAEHADLVAGVSPATAIADLG
jgi:hypothetical protein